MSDTDTPSVRPSPSFEALSRELRRAHGRIAKLVAALHRYGRHDDGEYSSQGACECHENGPDTCTCGLDDALREKP
jgi:hypothetical protein